MLPKTTNFVTLVYFETFLINVFFHCVLTFLFAIIQEDLYTFK